MRELADLLTQDLGEMGWQGYKKAYRKLSTKNRRLLLGGGLFLFFTLLVAGLYFAGVSDAFLQHEQNLKNAEKEYRKLAEHTEKMAESYEAIAPDFVAFRRAHENIQQTPASGAEVIRRLEQLAMNQGVQITRLTPILEKLRGMEPADKALNTGGEKRAQETSERLEFPTFALMMESCGAGMSQLLFLDTLLQMPPKLPPFIALEIGEFTMTKSPRCDRGEVLFSGELSLLNLFEAYPYERLHHDLTLAERAAYFTHYRQRIMGLNYYRQVMLKLGRDPFILRSQSAGGLGNTLSGSDEMLGDFSQSRKEIEPISDEALAKIAKTAPILPKQKRLTIGETIEGITFIGTLEQGENQIALIRDASGRSIIIEAGDLFSPNLQLLRVDSGGLILIKADQADTSE